MSRNQFSARCPACVTVCRLGGPVGGLWRAPTTQSAGGDPKRSLCLVIIEYDGGIADFFRSLELRL